jgi:hypothetical protein
VDALERQLAFEFRNPRHHPKHQLPAWRLQISTERGNDNADS